MLDEPRETYIEILHRSDRTLVTSLGGAFSHPTRREPGYVAIWPVAATGLLVRNVHLVELDFLLGGKRLPLRVPLPAADYYAFVAHAGRRPDCDVYSWTMPEPLPALPIPLRAPDPDIVVDLDAVYATAYLRGGYQRDIDYALPPPVTVSEDRQRWIAERLQSSQA